MEDVLTLYERPYDARYPVICVDERPCQLIGDVIVACAMKPGRSKRLHHEYERHGVATVFVAIEPLSGKRLLKVTERRTRGDYAEFIREVSAHWSEAEQIRLVQDNLNTHTPGSFYLAFSAEEAFALGERFEWHYTPVKASWLNMAEIELSVLAGQCLDRRIASIEELSREVAAYAANRQQQKITWRFTKNQARTKLGRHYDRLSKPI
jgi:hypothetical protein